MASSSSASFLSASPLSTRSIDLLDGTTVSYVSIPPFKSKTTSAVVHFGPLSACAAATLPWATLWQECRSMASLITVDRPGCHETSAISDDSSSNDEDWVLRRMRVNTHNVLAVLEAEEIDTVYILAVCLGHAYAIDFARALLHHPTIRLQDISLVAPFVSPACPHTWFLARLGNAVPSFLLTGATDAAVAIGASLTPYFVGPSAIKKMLSADEQTLWKDPEDYEYTCRVIEATQPLTTRVRALEARFGSSSVWQQVLDDFAKEAGYGFNDGTGKSPVLANNGGESFLFPRIKIHVSPHDGMVNAKAAAWLAQRCYADCDVVLHEEMSSHLTMTLMGGPPRNPRLLRHICAHEFGVLKAGNSN